MKKKQTLAVLLAAAMVLSMPVGVYAEELTPEQGQQQQEVELFGTLDSQAPELKKVSVDKETVQAGETLIVTLNITDDVSEVRLIDVSFLNEETGKRLSSYESWVEPSENDTYQVFIQIPQNEPEGNLILEMVRLKDVAGNEIYYGTKKNENLNKHVLPNEITVQIVNQSTEDREAPNLIGLSVTPEVAVAGSTFSLNLNVTDDVSGVDYVSAYFVNKQNGRTIPIFDAIHEPVTEGKIQVEWTLDEFEANGIFYLDQVELRDVTGNQITYWSKERDYPTEPHLPQEVTLTVTNEGTEDITAPELEDIEINKTEVEAPGNLSLTVKARDDKSGIYHVDAYFVNEKNGKTILVSQYFHESETGSFELNIPVGEFEPSGVFELDHVSLRDHAGNTSYYYSNKKNYGDSLYLTREISFFVHNSDESITEGDIITSTKSDNLVSQIENMGDSNTAYIYYGNNDVLPADVFEAIKGTNKTIVLESAGIQWIFNGQSITDKNIKGINLNTTIEEKYSSDSEASEELPWEQKAIILSFEDNGPLPGPAKIRVKMDYAFQSYVGTENLYVYYYDNTNEKFELVGEKLTITDDEYLEFTITHNSDFVITSGPIKTQEEENPDNPNPPVNPGEDDKPVNPSNPSNPTTPSRPNSSAAIAPGTPINYESEKPDPADEQAVEAYNFWQNTKREIRVYERAGSLRVYVPADVTYMPASVMETLRVENVPVVLQWQGHRIEIPAGKAQPKQPLKAYWPMKTLCELYNA